ncbi:MAG: hypothetical protein HeimC3_20720 [Candidatus Heimdallarchaeota archaeon LC_3]|nr:MAG: hypothetical protein HeimC3_20720 [Candidatus Heimdallarchaeota archaeon LC_3]
MSKDKKNSKLEKDAKKEKKKDKKPVKKSRRTNKPVRVISVDLWRTGLHMEEIGIKKKEELMSKSRQFTRNMDIIGEIKEKDSKKDNGIIAINQGVRDEKLILKAFTGSIGWMGTLEETIAQEVSQSLALDRNFPAYVLIIDKYEYILNLEKLFGGAGHSEKHHITIYHKDKTFDSFVIKERRLGIGDDWNIVDEPDDVIAEIDGKKFDIGGQWDIKIYNDDLAKHRAFVTAMILFCASRKYHKEVEKRIGKIIANKKKGIKFTLDHNELQLYKNPRLRK